uniref:Transposase n=1 Tax=Astatotilapia calliptera TaxID=8154 RepID=A0AAX7UNM5_ASTCA
HNNRPHASHSYKSEALKKRHEKKPNKSWEHLLWSDETKINAFGSDGVQPARSATVKHGGGSVMIRGCVSEKGHCRLTRPYHRAMGEG